MLINAKAQNSVETDKPKDPIKPDVQINVNRELDQNGNVIRYDSTYSWSWSSDGSQPVNFELFGDSIGGRFFQSFDDGFFQSLDNPVLFDDNYFNSFGSINDSLFLHPFEMPELEYLQKHIREMMYEQQRIFNDYFETPSENKMKNNSLNKEENKPVPSKSNEGIDI
jgi:hypothetical protein